MAEWPWWAVTIAVNVVAGRRTMTDSWQVWVCDECGMVNSVRVADHASIYTPRCNGRFRQVTVHSDEAWQRREAHWQNNWDKGAELDQARLQELADLRTELERERAGWKQHSDDCLDEIARVVAERDSWRSAFEAVKAELDTIRGARVYDD